MDVFEAIAGRRSVRKYKPDPVPDGVLARVLEAGRLAPSGHNRQPWRFVVVRDQGRRSALADAAAPHNSFIAEAPVVVAFLGFLAYEGAPAPDARSRGSWTWDMYVRYNVAIAAAYVTLAATAEGLGTCWIGAFDQDTCRRILGVEPPAKIIELLPIGYPAVEPHAKTRKSLDEVVCREQFS